MDTNFVMDEADASYAVESEPTADVVAVKPIWMEVVKMLEDWFGEESDRVEGEQVKCAYMSDDVISEETIRQAQEQPTSETRIEIFDSGCSCHISPYCEAFSTLEMTAPRPLRAANQQSFSAIGKGEMIINLPNGAMMSQLKLKEVLYSPKAGYTLISIRQLDEAGYTTTFSNGKCTIRNPGGTCIAEIPRNKGGLYKLVRESEVEANGVMESLTLNTLHCRLGHISPKAAQTLVWNGLVKGIKLCGDSSTDFFCESCAYAKAT